MPSRALRLAAGVAVVSTCVSVSAAPAAYGGTTAPYCRLDVGTGALTCASTEAGLQTSGARLTAAAASATYVLGRLYDDVNRTGPYLELTAGAPCDTSSDVDWEVSNVGATWNDRTSSFQGYNACQVKVFENAGYTGGSVGPLTSTDYVGAAMNDRTTSVRFS